MASNIVLCLFVTVLVICECKEKLRVRTEYGPVRGRQATTIGARKPYIAFQGIPYAKPPIGKLRFAAPVKPKQWTRTHDATKLKSSCIEVFTPQGSEDCLYLNVYTPDLNQSLPVIVWIHGGSFAFVYKNYTLDGVDHFIDEDVVFVTIQYRLGAFGFLSTEDSTIPGNFGLKDQLFAVEWIYRNIHSFGGDPSKITLMGQSSGAVAASFLGMHPKLEGKIRGIIQQSGGSLMPFSLAKYAKMAAYILSSKLGVLSIDSAVILEELRKKDAEELRNASLSTYVNVVYGSGAFASLAFSPVREPYAYEGAFFSKMMYEEFKRGSILKIPRMIGITSEEGIFLEDEFNRNRNYYSGFDQQILRYLPMDMHSTNEFAAKSVKEHYVGNNTFLGNITKTIHYASDDQFVRPILKEASLISSHSHVYLYHFVYEGKLGKSNRTMSGVDHGEDIEYLFQGPDQPKPSDSDNKVRKMLVRLWTNFAKHGNPTPTKDELFGRRLWLPINPESDDVNCFEIGDEPKLILNPHQRDVQFWDRLYAEHGNPPYDTY